MNRNYLIKPASSICNMRCRYCFYEDEAEHRSIKSMGVMSDETADALIERALSGLGRRDAVTFAFQGGEPTAAGKDFFRRFTGRVRELNAGRARVSCAIQTNGLVLDGEWAELFRENGFLVGVSVDGDKALHDLNRVDASGAGTWSRVVKNMKMLLAAGVEVNILCVVTRQCAGAAQRVYNALKKLGVRNLQFIACLDPIDEPRGTKSWSLTPEDYGKFLCRLFDAWYLDWKNGRYVSVRLFDDFVRLAMGFPAGTCATSGSCGAYFVVEGDGSVYPCDFYVLDEWKIGNVRDMAPDELASSETALRFLDAGLKKPEKCRRCRWLPLCNGGCRRDWYEESGVLNNYYCASFQTLFNYAGGRIEEIARAERSPRR